MEPLKVHSFVPGQLLFLIGHDQLESSSLADRLEQHPVLKAARSSGNLQMQSGRTITFEPRGAAASPQPIKLPSGKEIQRPQRFSLMVADMPVGEENLIKLIDDLDVQLVKHNASEKGAEMTLHSVALNWLSAASDPSHLGTGGPGAKPVYSQIDPQWFNSPVTAPGAPFAFTLKTLLDCKGGGEGVEVAILDTAPTAAALQAAFTRWGANHPLLRSLLGPNGSVPNNRLRITYDNSPAMQYLHVPEQGNGGFDIAEHDYKMSDHGLFAAGIIHSIAPNATLHLIQVLNDYGVGSMETIARGLQIALEQRDPDKKLVVNMSLMLSIPLDGHPRPTPVPARLFSDGDFLHRMGWPVEWACNALRDAEALVVAAAGNDGQNGNRPRSRYPAAFEQVVGVSALRKNSDQPAPYSNLADNPSTLGIATYGGDMGANGYADPVNGVLGVYIGEFPNQTPNDSGWARWAGTSFAAPAISGALALLRSQSYSPDDAVEKIYQAQPERTILPGDEEIFSITQGS